MKKTRLWTEPGHSYYDGTGAYQEIYDKSYTEENIALVLKSLKKLYYEYFNNGNCNVLTEEYEGYSKTVNIDEYYVECLENIRKTVEDTEDAIDWITEIMLDKLQNQHTAYDNLADNILHYIATEIG